ncbi:MAG: DUF202 domain-containing protein [Spirochaetota bacterium]|nr:DUF202 domain-containing protein [Spirochaetota bacterium]
MYDKTDKNKLILRDHLALDRTLLANERTLLAYQRTAIMLLISGVSILKLFEESLGMIIFAYILIPCAIIVGIIGYFRYIKIKKKISPSTNIQQKS